MKFPCEIAIWHILPGVRSLLAKELTDLGLTQKEVSEKLGLTQASVSYYLSKKRGSKVKFGEEVKEEIKKIAKEIKEDESDMGSKICHICKLVREDETFWEEMEQDKNIQECDVYS